MPNQSETEANRPPGSVELVVPRLEAELRLQAQIDKGNELLDASSEEGIGSPQLKREQRKWEEYNFELLKAITSTKELAYSYRSRFPFWMRLDELMSDNTVRPIREQIQVRVTWLESLVGRLEFIPEHVSEDGKRKFAASRSSRRVFLVHGHDEEAKQSVARALERMAFDPIILHEQSNRGLTIIEKFEEYSDVAYAVVLLTPDDVGAAGAGVPELKPRARQNVILELGYFLGKLGRERVCALHKGNVELPSDFSGVLWVPMDSEGAWRYRLAREMKAVGLKVNIDRIII